MPVPVVGKHAPTPCHPTHHAYPHPPRAPLPAPHPFARSIPHPSSNLKLHEPATTTTRFQPSTSCTHLSSPIDFKVSSSLTALPSPQPLNFFPGIRQERVLKSTENKGPCDFLHHPRFTATTTTSTTTSTHNSTLFVGGITSIHNPVARLVGTTHQNNSINESSLQSPKLSRAPFPTYFIPRTAGGIY